jgi:hypothetical protein
MIGFWNDVMVRDIFSVAAFFLFTLFAVVETIPNVSRCIGWY